MVDQFFTAPAVLRRLYLGPLSSYLDKFAVLLSQQGYARSTVRDRIRLVADLSRWLDRRQLDIDDLDERIVGKFLKRRRRQKCVRRGYNAALRLLLEQMRNDGVIPRSTAQMPESDIDRIEHLFARYLAQERGLSRATLLNYLPPTRHFLSERFGTGSIQLDKLRPSDITSFILRHAKTLSPCCAKLMVTALRSFLRFLYLRGDITIDLAASVPTVADWRLSTLPKSLQPEEVERLLENCNQTTPAGKRDYTVLLLLARLGLRTGEVVAMTLDDINWEAGELTVRGKGSRQDVLPIPQDVGEALATYLRYGRPRCSMRQVFIRTKAPHQGFSSSVAICDIVRRALARADLHPARKGAHLLRHSLATEMLRKGASLAEIGEVLRHRLPTTTEIYTKVDLVALRKLAQPWPGGEA